ncbi:MAG: ChbG/HpnK family deacetylase, partial [Terriglobia bacterium]
DMGYTHTGNVAILDCLRGGFIKSAAILAVSPWFEEGARIAQEHPEFCFGVHLGIIGEWRGYRWRPVLPYSEVRTLADEDGFLWRSPAEFWGNNPDSSELEREFRAQISLAQKKGVRVEYIDTHYILPSHPKFHPVVERISKDTGIPVSGLQGEEPLEDFGIYSAPLEQKEYLLASILERLQPGLHLLIAHPGRPSLENDALIHFEPKDVQAVGVGRNRAAETQAYLSQRIKDIVAERGIKLMSYRELKSLRAAKVDRHEKDSIRNEQALDA